MTDVLAIAEHRRDELREVSFELITAGRELADALGGDLNVAVISDDVERYAEKLDRTGVDTLFTVVDGEEFNHDVYVQAVEQLYEAVDPAVLMIPNTVNGLDYAPALADELNLPLVTDVIDLDGGNGLTATREMYGSKVETTIEVDPPAAVTIRSGEWPESEGGGDATVTSFDADIAQDAVRVTVEGYEEVAEGDVDISDAEVLVSIGRGIEEEKNLDLIFELADALDATVSSSRPIVDNGWLPKNRQVGQSGKAVSPEVYIAIGISGAVQHIAGMKDSNTIVAINTDPAAPIFDIADYGVVGDLFEVVPQLIEEFGGDPPDV